MEGWREAVAGVRMDGRVEGWREAGAGVRRVEGWRETVEGGGEVSEFSELSFPNYTLFPPRL